MRLPLMFAVRYLFGKKSTQAINIISGIAITGVAVATATMIVVLSVFNGFESLIAGMINRFNPDIKITTAQGKYFDADSALEARLLAIPGVDRLSFTLEETALFEYEDTQDFGILKGVDEQFNKVTLIDSNIIEGQFLLYDSSAQFGVLGAGIRSKLNINMRDLITPMFIYLPNRKIAGPMDRPFARRSIYPAGVFQLEQEYDYNYCFVSIELLRQMLKLPRGAGAVELSLSPDADTDEVIAVVRQSLGPEYIASNRLEQQSDFLRLMNMEKLVSFGILSFILVIVSFNLIGSLWMIALEKQQDVSVLKAMGATDSLIARIFRLEGMLLVGTGLLLGLLLGLAFYILQVNFGILRIPEGFLVNSYPIELDPVDFLSVSVVVLFIGWVSCYFPVKRAVATPGIIREE